MNPRQQRANAIRALSMDAVQKANSGHPGAPMGMADIAEVLWRDVLKHNPTNPNWPNRDRFVLSNGHASMLQYALLHLTGYDLGIDDLKAFRQLGSRTPGHPEYGYTPGVETTTGPLGQGLANAVGMAVAEQVMAARFNRDTYAVIDHHTYVTIGDGCLMEGISHEVCSLAGTLKLGKLIALYDDNGISIDGEVNAWFADDTAERFRSYGWQVIADVDGHDADAIAEALEKARSTTDVPSLICFKTVIGYGSPGKAGKAASHGAPLGGEETELTRAALSWPHAPFEIPDTLYKEWDCREKGTVAETEWNHLFAAYKADYPELAGELERRLGGGLPADFADRADQYIALCQEKQESMASRKASQNALNAYGPLLPELMGGSADLAGSNLTFWSGSRAMTAESGDANYLHFGVREFGMTAITNGMALYGGFLPYNSTFLIFMEYGRNAVRMSALMKQRVVHVYTHDSIGLGEDGPTHQPVEQLANLRLTPELHTWRPCDTVESAVAWKSAITRSDGPSALVFSRQTLPCQPRSGQQLHDVERGGYILRDCAGEPELILIATGSEVQLAMQAADVLAGQGRAVRVVSLPCTELFEAQSADYQQKVLPLQVGARIAIEAAAADYWYKYTGLEGRIIGMTSFGESGPADQLFAAFGLTVENVVSTALELVDLDEPQESFC